MCVAVALLLCVGTSRALAGPHQVVTIIPPSHPVHVQAGHSAIFTMHFRVDRGWHIFGPKPLVPGVRPAVLSLTGTKATKVLFVDMQKARKVYVKALSHDANVYINTVTVTVKLLAAKTAAGLQKLTGHFSFQACSDRQCRMPTTINFTVPLQVTR